MTAPPYTTTCVVLPAAWGDVNCHPAVTDTNPELVMAMVSVPAVNPHRGGRRGGTHGQNHEQNSTAESVGWVLTRAVMVASPPQLMDTEPLSPCTAVHLLLGF